MRIAWLQDYNPIEHPRMGAEQNDWNMIRYGITNRGHDIRIFTPNSIGEMGKPDIVIISNATMFNPNLLKTISMNIPTMWFLHDYWPLCKHRLFYPKISKCKTCKSRSFWLPVILKAKKIIWLSPLHRRTWLYAYPELKDIPYAIIPSAVDVNLFYNMKTPREKNSYLLVSPYSFKSLDSALRALKKKTAKVYWCGSTDSEDKLTNFIKLDNVPQEEMNRVYNRVETFFHAPSGYDPFSRVTVEARLAGCKLMVDPKKIGCMSYKWFKSKDERIREECRNAPIKFWQEVEKCV